MVYSTRKQTERFEDALMELGALGLLEIEGQKLLQESSELNAAEETQPTEKTWNTVKKELVETEAEKSDLQSRQGNSSGVCKSCRVLLCCFPWDRIDFGCFGRCQRDTVPAAFFGI